MFIVWTGNGPDLPTAPLQSDRRSAAAPPLHGHGSSPCPLGLSNLSRFFPIARWQPYSVVRGKLAFRPYFSISKWLFFSAIAPVKVSPKFLNFCPCGQISVLCVSQCIWMGTLKNTKNMASKVIFLHWLFCMDKTLSWTYFLVSSHPNALKTQKFGHYGQKLWQTHSTGALAKIENATIHLDKSKWKNNC